MANETTTTSASSTVYAKVITADILNELRPLNVTRPYYRIGPKGSSLVCSFTTQTKVAITEVRAVTEGNDQSTITQMATSNQDATGAIKGMIAFVTDLLVTVSVLDALPHFSGVLARTMAEQYETDLCGFTSFTNVSGAAASPTSMATLLDARTKLAGRDVHDVGLVAVIHTKQFGDVQQDLVTSGSTFLAGANSASGLLQNGMEGQAGNPFGFPILQTSVVPTADTATSRAGFLFVAGEALGLYELWGIRTELQRDASKVGTEVVLTMDYGTAKIDNARGQTVKGSA